MDQGTKEWWELHRGRPTASNFDRIITPKTMKPSSQEDGYICELIAQIMLPQMNMVPDSYISRPMLDGIALEPEARRWYEFEREVEVTQIGFVHTDCGRFGCSPDAMIGTEGCLELKCPLPKTHIAYLIAGTLPDDYRCQVHGELLVTGCAWCDFVSYCPSLPPFIVRVTPDKFTEELAKCLNRFDALFRQRLAFCQSKLGAKNG